MNPYSPPGASAPPAYGTDDRAGVTDLTVEMLRQTRPWVLFISVMSFIGSAFMLLGGVAMLLMGLAMPSGRGPNMAILSVFYIPMAFLYVYPALKLWSYGSSIAKVVVSRAPADLEQALAHQKSFWKFVGISMLVLIGLYVVAIIGAVAVGAMAAGSHRSH
jgi:hypothetical protein